MKKGFKLLIAVIAVFAVFVAVGCGKSKDLGKYAGTYEGKYTRFVGDPEDVRNEDEFELVLKEDGTGTHYRDTLEIKVTWDMNGDKITMTETFMGMEIEYTGKIDGINLVLYNGDEKDDFTAQYVYAKKE